MAHAIQKPCQTPTSGDRDGWAAQGGAGPKHANLAQQAAAGCVSCRQKERSGNQGNLYEASRRDDPDPLKTMPNNGVGSTAKGKQDSKHTEIMEEQGRGPRSPREQ